MLNQTTNRQARARAEAPAIWRQQSRPWRVVPLALLAVVGTTAAMGAATQLFWTASHHRYADDILRKDFSRVHLWGLLGSN